MCRRAWQASRAYPWWTPAARCGGGGAAGQRQPAREPPRVAPGPMHTRALAPRRLPPQLVGVVSKKDLSKGGAAVRDVMTATPISCKATDKVTAAAHAMLDNKIHRVPVVDDGGKCVGIVTRTDIFWELASQSDRAVSAAVFVFLPGGRRAGGGGGRRGVQAGAAAPSRCRRSGRHCLQEWLEEHGVHV